LLFQLLSSERGTLSTFETLISGTQCTIGARRQIMSSNNDCDGASDKVSVVLFGPETTRWTKESLSDLQSALQINTRLKFLKETLIELLSLWPALDKHFAHVNFRGHESFQQLSDFAAGKKIPDPKSLRNIHLAPLTIVDQICQFVTIAENLGSGGNADQPLELPTFEAAQGFCMGFLSAAAVSSSNCWADLERHISNALRLAGCIGAVVDNYDSTTNPTTSVSLRWKTDSDRTYLETCLDLLPDVSFPVYH
jgi:hypothetical protein